MAKQKQPPKAATSNDDATALWADERVDYSATIDRKPLKLPRRARLIVWRSARPDGLAATQKTEEK